MHLVSLTEADVISIKRIGVLKRIGMVHVIFLNLKKNRIRIGMLFFLEACYSLRAIQDENGHGACYSKTKSMSRISCQRASHIIYISSICHLVTYYTYTICMLAL